MTGKKFEYLKKITDSLYLHEMNDLGKVGWELVSVHRRYTDNNEYIFKREVS